jgi:hypothetical protein
MNFNRFQLLERHAAFWRSVLYEGPTLHVSGVQFRLTSTVVPYSRER